jgi:hypothetical protein
MRMIHTNDERQEVSKGPELVPDEEVFFYPNVSPMVLGLRDGSNPMSDPGL